MKYMILLFQNKLDISKYHLYKIFIHCTIWVSSCLKILLISIMLESSWTTKIWFLKLLFRNKKGEYNRAMKKKKTETKAEQKVKDKKT